MLKYFCLLERCPSGLRCGSRKSVRGNPPRVRIPPSPDFSDKLKLSKMFVRILLTILLLFLTNRSFAEPKICFNESLLVYNNCILIPNFGQPPHTKERAKAAGYILYYKNNKLQEYIPPDGNLEYPTAMAVHRKNLFICNRNNLLIYDITNLKKQPQKITFRNNNALNDLAISDGNLYITSTDKNRIYKINLNSKNFTPQKWIDIPSPNGIIFHKNTAYIASIPADYKNVKEENVVYIIKDKNNPKAEKFNSTPGLYDGLAISKDGKTLYVSDWKTSSIKAIDTSTKKEKTVYFEKNLSPADIALEKKQLLIPDMMKHRIIIFDLTNLNTKLITN